MRVGLVLTAVVAALSLNARTVAEVQSPDVSAYFDGANVRIVNIWATWCVPCVAEMDDLKALDEAFGRAQVQLIGISLDDALPGDRMESKKRVAPFLDRKSVAFRNFYYTGAVPVLQEHYSFEGEIPLTVIYDRHGIERARYQGRISLEAVRNDIRKLLDEKGGNAR
jgi:thiol-disulfide isomerase/thioredoxin